MRNGWDPNAFDRWLTTEPEPAHPVTCTCWKCQEDPFAGLPEGEPVGFGACETEEYPKYGAEEFD